MDTSYTASRYHIFGESKFGQKCSKMFIIPQRIILAIMCFLAIVHTYTLRICLSQAITMMVVAKNRTNTTSGEEVCDSGDTLDTDKREYGTYEWSELLQGYILGANYVGYFITHLPGGILADKYGGKWVLSLGILFATICTALVPIMTQKVGPYGLITVRALQGLGEGTVFPALSVLLSAWVPKHERGKIGAFVFGGGQFGTIVTNMLSGLILSSSPWPTLFYIFAGGAFLWFIIFTLLCYSYPGVHPFIKAKERDYLLKEVGIMSRRIKAQTPWCQIFKCPPVIVTIVAQLGHDWGFFVMVSGLPKYMADVLNFSIKKNGLYTSFPYIGMWISSIISGIVADHLIKREIWSVTTTRRVMTFIAACLPGVFMVAASYGGCNRILVVALFSISMLCMGPYYAGMKLGPLDMSPNYAGVLMALTNGIGSITGVIAPAITGLLTPNAALLEWRIVFWVAFVILTVTAIIYVIWASGEVQPFDAVGNTPPESVNKDKDKGKDKD